MKLTISYTTFLRKNFTNLEKNDITECLIRFCGMIRCSYHEERILSMMDGGEMMSAGTLRI